MPWSPNQASKFNKGVTSNKQKRKWSNVANSVLQRTGDEGAAIRAANGVTRGSIQRRMKKRSITGA